MKQKVYMHKCENYTRWLASVFKLAVVANIYIPPIISYALDGG